MERHFYHFQQALEHLSAVLFAKDEAEKATAERNARAFLTRMTRLQEAKGTIANEVQRMDAGLKETEKKIRDEGGQV
jgi:peptidoglycan hydrolase CwlO-like protein